MQVVTQQAIRQVEQFSRFIALLPGDMRR